MNDPVLYATALKKGHKKSLASFFYQDIQVSLKRSLCQAKSQFTCKLSFTSTETESLFVHFLVVAGRIRMRSGNKSTLGLIRAELNVILLSTNRNIVIDFWYGQLV